MTRRRAFVIGDNGPSGAGITKLRFAEKDAERLASVLSSDGLDYEVCVSGQCSAFEHLARLDKFASESQRGDLLLVYFSGHGYLPNSGLYLLCEGSDLSGPLVTTSIPLSMIRSILENCVAGIKVLVLDCCHSGAAVGEPWETKDIDVKPHDRLAQETRDSASLVIAASERMSVARESEYLGGGVMTTFLINGLKQLNLSDKDGDGRLSLAEMMEWLRGCTTAYNAKQKLEHQVDSPILYGNSRGDVFLTPEVTTPSSKAAAALIRESVIKVRTAFAEGKRIEIKTLQNLAKPIGINAVKLTSLTLLDELFGAGDDAALFSAAVILYVKRETAYTQALIEAFGPHLRDAALWRMLRAMRRTLVAREIDANTKTKLLDHLRAVAQSPARLDQTDYGPHSVLGKIKELIDHLGLAGADVFTTRQLAMQLPRGDGGRLRQWNGKIRLYYNDRDCRVRASSYTMLGDFIDDVYERLVEEGSQISEYTYGLDWALEANGTRLPNPLPQNTTTLLDLGLRDDQRIKFIQLAEDAKLTSRQHSARKVE